MGDASSKYFDRVLRESGAPADITGQMVAIALYEHKYTSFKMGEPGNWDAKDRFRTGTATVPSVGVTVLFEDVRTWWAARKIKTAAYRWACATQALDTPLFKASWERMCLLAEKKKWKTEPKEGTQ